MPQVERAGWAGVLIQADEILDAISDGVAVVDPDLRIMWANPEFHSLADPTSQAVGSRFYRALGNPAQTLLDDPRCGSPAPSAAPAPPVAARPPQREEGFP